MFQFTLRSQTLIFDSGGHALWQPCEQTERFAPKEVAAVIVDMWDRHWSAGATQRCAALAKPIDQAARRMREKGALIIHAPSDTMDFYQDHPARRRALDIPLTAPPRHFDVKDRPLPIDSGDSGSDTGPVDAYPPNTAVWTRQNPGILIDEERDLILDEGAPLFSYCRSNNIRLLCYMGVHTNFCVLNRSFAVKAALRQGLRPALVRDLTDAMYNPARPPYVSHAQGTRLVVEYIEKFYCPSILSDQII